MARRPPLCCLGGILILNITEMFHLCYEDYLGSFKEYHPDQSKDRDQDRQTVFEEITKEAGRLGLGLVRDGLHEKIRPVADIRHRPKENRTDWCFAKGRQRTQRSMSSPRVERSVANKLPPSL